MCGTLRQVGHLSVAQFDDSFMQADIYDHCIENNVKSLLDLTQRPVFLGFFLDSFLMRISPTPEKASKLRTPCQQLVDTVLRPSIRQVGGLLTFSFPVVTHGSQHYRWIEIA